MSAEAFLDLVDIGREMQKDEDLDDVLTMIDYGAYARGLRMSTSPEDHF